MDNLYNILGIDKNASEQDIKKAYRKMSLKYHPDRVASKSKEEQETAAEMMQNINKAYEILSDSKKKEIYDLTGSVEQAEKGEMGFGGFGDFGGFGGFGGGVDINDIFGDIFGRGRSSSRSQGRPVEPGSNLQVRLKVSIEELFNPRERKIVVKRQVRCPECHGSGGKTCICEHCHGTGMITETQRQGFAMIRQTRPCPYCNGTGQQVTEKCKNKDCENGFVKKDLEKTILFPQGVQNGQYIVYQNEGNESKTPGGQNGSLIVIAQYDFDNNIYTVEGADVIERVSLNYEDCILGKKITHTLPDGKDISLTIPALTVPGKKFLLRNRGLRMRDDHGREIIGNYYIEVVYQLPETLSEDEKLALQDIQELRN